MKINIFADGWHNPQEITGSLRIYDYQTEIFFDTLEEASKFFDSLKGDDYYIFVSEDGFDYTADVTLCRDIGVRIKAWPYTCVTFHLRDSVLDHKRQAKLKEN